PSPRMQYSASSFAERLVAFFAFALRPRARIAPPRGPFPSSASFHAEVPEVVLDLAVTPAFGRIGRVFAAVRRTQHGRVNAYLLGLGRFFTVAAALDTGSAFEGMGAAREATFSCLTEPALFFGLLVLVRTSGSLSLGGMLGPSLAAGWTHAGASLVLVCVTL